jgi:hypothetical protein
MNSAYQFENEPNVSTRKELEDQFREITGLNKSYLKKLSDEEVAQIYEFFTQTSAGRKFAEAVALNTKQLRQSNQSLGREREEKLKIERKKREEEVEQTISYAQQQIDLVKNESDAKLINIAKAVRNLLNKPIGQIRFKKDLSEIWDLIHKSLWS